MDKTIRLVAIFALVTSMCLAGYCMILIKEIRGVRMELYDLKRVYEHSEVNITGYDEKIAELEHQVVQLKKRMVISEDPLYEEYKRKVTDRIESGLEGILSKKPMHGGQWLLTDVTFISPFFAVITYEDGHDSEISQVSVSLTETGQMAFKLVEL